LSYIRKNLPEAGVRPTVINLKFFAENFRRPVIFFIFGIAENFIFCFFCFEPLFALKTEPTRINQIGKSHEAKTPIKASH
jgi:hypothetical protein